VASSVVLVSTQPVFVAMLSVALLKEAPSRRQWARHRGGGRGRGVIGWGDFAGGPEPLLGDLLAVAGAVFVSVYYVIGRGVRQRLDLWSYIAVVYGVAAIVLLGGAALHPGVAVAGYPGTDWLVFLALAAGPMMIGHTGVNYALRYLPAYVANLALLGEPIGATLLAWWLPGIRERPSMQLGWAERWFWPGSGWVSHDVAVRNQVVPIRHGRIGGTETPWRGREWAMDDRKGAGQAGGVAAGRRDEPGDGHGRSRGRGSRGRGGGVAAEPPVSGVSRVAERAVTLATADGSARAAGGGGVVRHVASPGCGRLQRSLRGPV
jgi:hypothetical protein